MMRLKPTIWIVLGCISILMIFSSWVFMNTEENGMQEKVLYGKASYYADKFEGRKTANGEIFRQKKLTAACNVLPLGTWLRVTNVVNGKIVIVKTNDRLHPSNRRIIDLTKAAAQKIDFIQSGLVRVKIEVIDKETALSESL